MPSDAAALVEFLDKLGMALHNQGKLLSLDVGTWSQVLWNHTLISNSQVDKAIDMST